MEEKKVDMWFQDLEKQLFFYFRQMRENDDSFFAQEAKNRGNDGILVKHLLNCNRIKERNIDKTKLLEFIESSEFFSISSDKLLISCNKKFNPPKTSKEERTIIVVGIPYYPSYEQSNKSEEFGFSSYKNQVIDWLYKEFSIFGCVLKVNVPTFHSSQNLRGYAFIEFSKRSAVSACIEKIYKKKIIHEDFGQLVINKNLDDESEIPVSSFTAKQAAAVSLSLKSQYERRYIWSCCSHKSKQVRSSWTKLLRAGYHQSNPMNHEYAVITNGVDPMVQDEKILEAKIMANYGPLNFLKLHVFPQSTWDTWKPKFYQWQSSWLARFARKTRKLTQQKMKSEYHQVPPMALEITQRVGKRTVFTGLEHAEELEEIIAAPLFDTDKLLLPNDFQPGSVAQFCIKILTTPDGKQFTKVFKAMLPSQGLVHVDFEVDNELRNDLSLDANETFYFARFSSEQQCKTAVSNCRYYCDENHLVTGSILIPNSNHEQSFLRFISRSLNNMKLKRQRQRQNKKARRTNE